MSFYYSFVTIHHNHDSRSQFNGDSSLLKHVTSPPHGSASAYLIHYIFLTSFTTVTTTPPRLTPLPVAHSLCGTSWSQCSGTHFPQSATHSSPPYTTWCHGVSHLTLLCHAASPCPSHPAGTPLAPTHGWLAGWLTSWLVGTAPTHFTYPFIIPRLIHPPLSPLRPLTNWYQLFMTFVHNERDSQ